MSGRNGARGAALAAFVVALGCGCAGLVGAEFEGYDETSVAEGGSDADPRAVTQDGTEPASDARRGDDASATARGPEAGPPDAGGLPRCAWREALQSVVATKSGGKWAVSGRVPAPDATRPIATLLLRVDADFSARMIVDKWASSSTALIMTCPGGFSAYAGVFRAEAAVGDESPRAHQVLTTIGPTEVKLARRGAEVTGEVLQDGVSKALHTMAGCAGRVDLDVVVGSGPTDGDAGAPFHATISHVDVAPVCSDSFD